MALDAQLRYLKRLELYEDEKPFQIFVNIPPEAPDQRYTNLEFETCNVKINDIRIQTNRPLLDTHGFQVENIENNLDYDSFRSREDVENVYLKDLEDMIKIEDPSVHRVFWFEWRLRSSEERKFGDTLDLNDYLTVLQPAMEVHVDQSPAAVLHRVQLQMGEEATELLQGRVRIMNFWKPLRYTVEDFPLAVCDARSVMEDDLAPTDHVRREFHGETFYAHHNEAHQWYYLSHQDPQEVLILKIFDSREDVEAKFCAHAAFRNPEARLGAPPRQTIEARALIFSK